MGWCWMLLCTQSPLWKSLYSAQSVPDDLNKSLRPDVSLCLIQTWCDAWGVMQVKVMQVMLWAPGSWSTSEHLNLFWLRFSDRFRWRCRPVSWVSNINTLKYFTCQSPFNHIKTVFVCVLCYMSHCWLFFAGKQMELSVRVPRCSCDAAVVCSPVSARESKIPADRTPRRSSSRERCTHTHTVSVYSLLKCCG